MTKQHEDEFYVHRYSAITEQLKNNEVVYPHKFFYSHTVQSIIEDYGYLKPEERLSVEVSLTGRVMAIRNFGKLTFFKLKDGNSTLQLVLQAGHHSEQQENEQETSSKNNVETNQEQSNAKLHDNFINNESAHSDAVINSFTGKRDNNFAKRPSTNNYQFTEISLAAAAKSIKRGDVVGIAGHPGRTRNNELSVFVTKASLLAPCIRTLPSEHFGLKEPEMIYRKRYLDLLLNTDSVARFSIRSQVISFIRQYLNALNFIEVETPMMNLVPGGAMAKPFITHHNELKMDLFMRISPELYLKQLVVGGMNRVYELGKQYRNEGIDLTHNPEFTTCEFYMAFADYHDLMFLTEDMLSNMVNKIFKTKKVEYWPEKRESRPDKVVIDFSTPFKRIDIVSELNKHIKINMKNWDDDGSQYTNTTFINNFELKSKDLEKQADFLIYYLRKESLKLQEPFTLPRILDKLIGEYLEPQCINPTFLINHPLITSPLAKKHRDDPFLTERFELFINGKEICNAYTELNDPIDQLQRFEEQAKDAAKGDDEAMMTDRAFVTALEYALPPTAGWGIGIDRLVMYLSNSANIRDVILFPAMRPEDEDS